MLSAEYPTSADLRISIACHRIPSSTAAIVVASGATIGRTYPCALDLTIRRGRWHTRSRALEGKAPCRLITGIHSDITRCSAFLPRRKNEVDCHDIGRSDRTGHHGDRGERPGSARQEQWMSQLSRRRQQENGPGI